MKTIINVENIKCGGCVNSITKNLKSIEGVESVLVNIEEGEIVIEHDELILRDVFVDKLLSMGYPEKGTLEGLSKVKANAKSFVSCAIGRIN